MKKSAKILGITIITIALFLLCACGQQTDKEQNQVCTLIIRCDTILKNTEELNPEKKSIIPESGIVFSAEGVSFNEGDSVLDILKQELQKEKIHLDFEENTATGSAYIKGIANIYSGDCGELSGWMVRVNGEDLTVGCSDYFPQNNDTIEWAYTCDMGNDL